MYEPGSTFKIITVSAALEENKISLSDTFFLENGKYKINGHTIKDDHKINGYASISKILEQSSNIGLVKIGQKLGGANLYKYVRKFGFYSLTGIDLPGEIKGSLLDVDKWSGLSLPTISFGQGIGVTALQMINAYCVIANDGILMKPSIVKSIESSDVFPSKEVRQVVSSETAKIVRQFLKNVVDFGTGKSAKTPGYTVGGKTGTSQKIDPGTKKYSTKRYTASFCGMLPALNPEIVILVVIDEPKGDYYGASVASPIFAKIAQRTAEYLRIKKDDIAAISN
jgi:cell division protein FtsI (penicillin-binding protein 3)